MKKILISFFILCTSLILLSCMDKTEIVDSKKEYTFLPIAELKYELVCSGPKRSQSMMLLCWDSKILIYGSWYLSLFNKETKSWFEKDVPADRWSGRWDGALGKVGDYIYAFGSAAFVDTAYHKATRFNLNTMNIELLPEKLPCRYSDLYPAYTTAGKNIIIVFKRLDSVYVFNAETEKGSFVAPNPFKVTDSEVLSTYTYNWGTYNNYLYVYKNSTAEFAKFNLTTYTWEMINIPQDIKQRTSSYVNAMGGVFDGLLLLIDDSGPQTLCYDIEKNIWGYANYDIDHDMWSEHSCKTDTELFILDYFPRDVWRVTRKK